MAAPLLKRLCTIAAKHETTVGTPIALGAGDGVYNAYDLEIQGEIEVDQREGQGSFNYLSGVPGARQGKMSFKCDIGWDGATVPPWASVLFPVCGMIDSGGVFQPESTSPTDPASNVKTATVGIYENGVLKQLAGAAGNCKLVLPAGRMAYCEFEFSGVWQPVVDSALITPVYPTYKPARFASATCTWNSVVQHVEQVEVDFGNEVIYRESPTTAAGIISALIVNRYPKITINPEAQLVADQDRYGDWIQELNNEYAFSSSLDTLASTGAASSIAVSAPKAQIFNLQEGDREKLLIDEIEFMCNKNGANHDEELSVTFA